MARPPECGHPLLCGTWRHDSSNRGCCYCRQGRLEEVRDAFARVHVRGQEAWGLGVGAENVPTAAEAVTLGAPVAARQEVPVACSPLAATSTMQKGMQHMHAPSGLHVPGCWNMQQQAGQVAFLPVSVVACCSMTTMYCRVQGGVYMCRENVSERSGAAA